MSKFKFLNKSVCGYLLSFVFFVLLGLVIFRASWGEDLVFSASDANIASITRTHESLPEGFSGSYSSVPVLGGVGKSAISVQKIARWILPPEVCADSLYAIYLIFSSLFLIAFLRVWSLGWLSCLAGSLSAFWVGSVTLASAGHDAKMAVMMLFAATLFLVEKAIRSTNVVMRSILALLAGLTTGLMLLEQQDVGLLAGLVLGPYVLFRLFQLYPKKPLVWIHILLPIALIGAGLSMRTALNAYSSNVTQAGLGQDPEYKWNFVTQWSMVPSEIADLIAPGYMGWSSGNPDGPYRGKIGQSAEWETTKKGFQNFKLDNLYIGFIPLFLAGVAILLALANRKKEKESAHAFLCWAALAVIVLLLSFGKYSALYKLFYHLPLVGNIRAPIKFLHNFQFIIGILAAFGLNELLRRVQSDKRTIFNRLFIACSIFAGSFLLLAISPKKSDFSQWGQYADAIVQTTRWAWIHVGLVAALLSGVFFCFSRKQTTSLNRFLPLILIGILAFDSIYLTSKYFKADNIAALKRGNPVINYLQEHQGNDRVYMTNQSGMYNRWLSMDGKYHQINFFNIWQMPRMPSEYKVFLEAAQKNAARLWQLTSCKYITASAGIVNDANTMKMFSPMLFYRFVKNGNEVNTIQIQQPETKSDQVLLEFKSHIPRVSLFTDWQKSPRDQQCPLLFSPEFNPLQTLVLDEGANIPEPSKRGLFQAVTVETSLQNVKIETDSDTSGVLLFTQRYQPQWQVTVDGKPSDLLRVNYLCMGVFVPAGKHGIEFSCNE